MSGWGVVHHCQGGCGIDVQYRGLKLFDAGTLVRHRCPNISTASPSISWLECLCGTDVEVIGNIRYDLHTTTVHVCYHTAQARPKAALSKKEKPPEPPDLSRIPRGAIIL